MRKTLLLSLLLLLPWMGKASIITVNNGYIYLILDTSTKKAKLASNPNKYSGDLTIPETITYNNDIYTVVAIGWRSLQNCTGLTSVTPALELALRSYEQLCCRYVPEGDNSALLHEFRQQLADLRNDAAFERELEESLSVSAPALLDAVRAVPVLKDGDRRLLRFLAAGIPTYMTGAVLGKSRSAVNMQVSRLRARIESLDDASLRDLLLPVLTSRHSGRPRR